MDVLAIVIILALCALLVRIIYIVVTGKMSISSAKEENQSHAMAEPEIEDNEQDSEEIADWETKIPPLTEKETAQMCFRKDLLEIGDNLFQSVAEIVDAFSKVKSQNVLTFMPNLYITVWPRRSIYIFAEAIFRQNTTNQKLYSLDLSEDFRKKYPVEQVDYQVFGRKTTGWRVYPRYSTDTFNLLFQPGSYSSIRHEERVKIFEDVFKEKFPKKLVSIIPDDIED